GFEDSRYSELEYARIVARTFGTIHHEEILRPSALDLLRSLVEHLDEPLGDPSVLPTYVLSRLARQHVKVVLSGDGGDELLAGYATHARHLRDNARGRLPAFVRRGIAGSGLELAARIFPRVQKVRHAAHSLRRTNRPFAQRFSSGFDKAER